MTEVKEYSEEASTIGLKPGEWPVKLTFRGVEWTRNRTDYTGQGEDRELASVSYTRPGQVLTVWND